MQYISSHTNIPAPKVYAVHTWERRIYIEMTYVRGTDLGTAWRVDDFLSADEKRSIFADIKQSVAALRDLKPPREDLVSSAFENPAYDGRVGYRFYGPCSHGDFHSLLRQHMPGHLVAELLGQDVDRLHKSSHRTCFTHADLAPHNIIVRDGRVAAIIDWAYAGWYPEYWEFTKAHYNYVHSDDWYEYLREALTCYDDELAAERVLWNVFSEPGTRTIMYRNGEKRVNEGSEPSKDWMEARAGRQPTDLWSLVEL